jgi:hypothetical protein
MGGHPLLDVRMMVVDQIVTDHPELLPAMMDVAVVKPEVMQEPLVTLVNPRRIPVQGTRQNFDVSDLPEFRETLERSRDGFDREAEVSFTSPFPRELLDPLPPREVSKSPFRDVGGFVSDPGVPVDLVEHPLIEVRERTIAIK